MNSLTRITTLIMVLALAACGDKFGQSERVNVSYSNKPAKPFVMPDRQLKRIFTAPGVSFYLDEQGKPISWGRQTCMPEDLDQVVSIANGISGPYAAVKSDGSVVTWNCYERSLPIPDDLRNVKALAIGPNHTLVLKDDGTVEAWGTGPGMTKMPPDLKDVVAVSAGEDHGLVLHRNGRVTAWDGYIGCCIPREAFPRVDLNGVVAIASGENHNLALRDDGTVVAWGSEDFFPAIPPGLTDEFGAIAIAVGLRKNYVLLANGSLWSWGWPSASLRKVKSLPEAVVDISAGDNHGLVQKRDGSLMSWGYGIASLLPSDLAGGVVSVASDLSLLLTADGEVIPLTDRQVVLGSDAPVLRVDADGGLAAAIHDDDTLSLWGVFIQGEGVTDAAELFADVKEAAFANSQTAIFLKTDGTVSLRSIYSNPQEAEFVAGLRDITSVQSSGGYFVALDEKGELVAWRLHDPDRFQVYRGPSMIKAIAASAYNILVLRTSGAVAVWDPEASTVADVVPALNEVDAIAGGYSTHLALKRDGTVIAVKAQLPDWLDDFEYLDPVPEGVADVAAIYSKSAQAALMRNGQLIVWGESHLLFDFYQLPE